MLLYYYTHIALKVKERSTAFLQRNPRSFFGALKLSSPDTDILFVIGECKLSKRNAYRLFADGYKVSQKLRILSIAFSMLSRSPE